MIVLVFLSGPGWLALVMTIILELDTSIHVVVH